MTPLEPSGSRAYRYTLVWYAKNGFRQCGPASEEAHRADDVCWTALNIREFGHVIVDRWILPDCARYTAGSFGSIDERMEQKLRESAYLVVTYPDLVRFAPKAGWPTGSHVVLR